MVKKNNNIDLLSYEYRTKDFLYDDSISEKEAVTIIEEELTGEGIARQNLATFCTTKMENSAVELMAKSLDKNAIDKTEYPNSAEIESSCLKIIADLWHAKKDFVGTSCIGSSEASMLAGLSLKFLWRERAKSAGLDLNRRPNIIITSGYQLCWERFSKFFDVELIEVPLSKNNLSLNVNEAMKKIDDYTIGVVAVLGITYTGRFDDIKTLNEKLEVRNKNSKLPVYIHVDAASGGFFTPFINPKLLWDFRVKNVISINASGHKYGLVYPGIGWIIWKEKKFLAKDLIFNVSYLGGMIQTTSINFSKSVSHIIGQYYNFIRFGKGGYTAIHKRSHESALFLEREIGKLKHFNILSDVKNTIPVVCYELVDGNKLTWDLYDLSDRLRMSGWQVPTYYLPKNFKDRTVQRIVIRADFSINLANEFLKDLITAIKHLSKTKNKTNTSKIKGFTH